MTQILIQYERNLANPDPVGNWNTVTSDVTDVSVIGTWVADLIDSDGALTGYSLAATSPFNDIPSGGPGVDAHGYEEDVWEYALRSPNGTAGVQEITGLPNGVGYTLVIGGYTGSITRDTKYTVDGVSKEHKTGSDFLNDAPPVFTGTVVGGKITISTELSEVIGQFYGFQSFIDLTLGDNNIVTVDVPTNIDLEWNTTHELAVTDDTGTVTLAGVTLEAPTGWETVTFDGTIPDTVATESFYEEAITDLAFTPLVGDALAFTSAAGLSVDPDGLYPTIDPPSTVTGTYKFWSVNLQSWTAESTYTWTDGGDVTPPVINLIDDNPLVWVQGTAWVDPGATVTDGTDATRTIVADSPPDVNIVSTQTISYNTQDAAGNVALTVTRDVLVTGVDTTPDQFTFLQIANATINTQYENVQPITGIVTGQTVSVTGGLVSNDGGATYSTSVGMLQGTTLVKATLTTGGANSTEYTQSVTVNGVTDVFSVTTEASSTLTFNIDTIRTTTGSAITYTYPIGEVWSGVPEEGGVKLDSSANVVITLGVGAMQSSLLSAGVDYLLILRDAGNNPAHYVRQWGQFA